MLRAEAEQLVEAALKKIGAAGPPKQLLQKLDKIAQKYGPVAGGQYGARGLKAVHNVEKHIDTGNYHASILFNEKDAAKGKAFTKEAKKNGFKILMAKPSVGWFMVIVEMPAGRTTEPKGPRKFRLAFYECEHGGDMDNYIDDVAKAGGRVTDTSLNEDAETCYLTIEVADYAAFLEAFKKTDSFGLSNLGD